MKRFICIIISIFMLLLSITFTMADEKTNNNPKGSKTALEVAQAKLKRKEADKLKLEEAKKRAEKKRQELKSASSDVKDLEKKVARSISNIQIITELAGILTEKTTKRAHEATTGFFNILNKFDDKDRKSVV